MFSLLKKIKRFFWLVDDWASRRNLRLLKHYGPATLDQIRDHFSIPNDDFCDMCGKARLTLDSPSYMVAELSFIDKEWFNYDLKWDHIFKRFYETLDSNLFVGMTSRFLPVDSGYNHRILIVYFVDDVKIKRTLNYLIPRQIN